MNLPPHGAILYGTRAFEDQVKDGTITTAIRPGRWGYEVGRRIVLASSSLNWAALGTITGVATKRLDEVTDAEAQAAGRGTAVQVRLDVRYVWSSPEFALDDLVTVVEWEMD